MKRMTPSRVLVYAVGVGMLLQLHTSLFAESTYTSENALLIGEGDTSYQRKHLKLAARLYHEYNSRGEDEQGDSSAAWLVEQLKGMGIGAGFFPFPSHVNNATQAAKAVVAVVRAPRTAGSEGIAIAARFHDVSHDEYIVQNGEVVSGWSVAVSIMKALSEVQWLSKDVLLVLTPDAHGDTGLTQWLEEYHRPSALDQHGSDRVMFRSGLIRAAVVLDVTANSMDHLKLSLRMSGVLVLITGDHDMNADSSCADGVNGALPNLDLVNTMDRLTRFVEHRSVVLFEGEEPLAVWLWGMLSRITDVVDVPYHAMGAAMFMLRSAIGVPTGDHAPFLEYNIEALTVGVTTRNLNDGTMLSYGRIVEGSVRSISNLIENLHQSFYFYILPLANYYVSIGHYMIPFGLVIASAGLVVARCVLSAEPVSLSYALARVGVFQVGGAVLFFLRSLPLKDLAVAYGLCVVLCGLASLLHQYVHWKMASGIVDSTQRLSHPSVVFSAAILPSLLALSVYALTNYSFCLLAAVVLVPFSAFMWPLETIVFRVPQVLMIGFISPPMLLLALSQAANIPVNQLWGIMLSHHESAGAYAIPFLMLLYLPFHTSMLWLAIWRA